MNNKTFNKKDYNSKDGMLTSVWGPSLWHSLHTISFNYPQNPTKQNKREYLNFFMSLRYVLPCKNRETLSKWLYHLHEEINTMLGKKSNLTYNDVRNRYEMFRARCIDEGKPKKKKKTQKREKGCTTPYYGKKSQCVINIVPKSKRCKTFKIDRECIIKKTKP